MMRVSLNPQRRFSLRNSRSRETSVGLCDNSRTGQHSTAKRCLGLPVMAVAGNAFHIQYGSERRIDCPYMGHVEDAMRKIMSILSMLAFAASARASGTCNGDMVTHVIMFNGYVYFSTSTSCNTWCLVPQTWSPAAQSQTFATLLAARITGQTVNINWADKQTDNCDEEPVNASPVWIEL
jgi:hypothetical protein